MAAVVLQMGHCFRRSGATGTAGEQDFVSDVATLAAESLGRAGHRPVVALADAAVPACDAFVALHCDGSVHPTAGGASFGYRGDDPSGDAGRRWQEAYQARGWPYGFRAANYTPNLRYYYATDDALRVGAKFAIVVEHGFLTHPDEARLLRSTRGKALAAWALVDLVDDVFGDASPPPEPPTTEEDEVLKEGDRGRAVEFWQFQLIKAGQPLEVDGVFDAVMRNRVKRVQRGFGLPETGDLDATTRARIHQLAEHA